VKVFKVFISSTSQDLTAYRAAARDEANKAGFHPELVMEDQGAHHEPGIVKACREKAGECDVTLAIIAWRLGWCPDTKRGGDGKTSITQYELEASKHRIVLLADDLWPLKFCDQPPDAVQKMRSELDSIGAFFGWENPATGLPGFRIIVQRELLKYRERLLPKVDAQEAMAPPLTLRPWVEPTLPERPYPLLEPYTHPDTFGGRDREITSLLEVLRGRAPVVGVYAHSGVGKSSLLRAGLLPRLRRAGVPVALDRQPEVIGLHGLHHRLLTQLVDGLPPNAVGKADSPDPQAFHDVLQRLRGLTPHPPILIVDQLEHVLRTGEEHTNALAILGALLAATAGSPDDAGQPLCRWVLAYRSEYHGDVEALMRDVLVSARRSDALAEPVRHLWSDFMKAGWFVGWPLAPLGTAEPGADPARHPEIARAAFLDAITKPLSVQASPGDPARSLHFATPADAERLAAVFAEGRQRDREAGLTPELQVTLERLRRDAEARQSTTLIVASDAEFSVTSALTRHMLDAITGLVAHLRGPHAQRRRGAILVALDRLATPDGRRTEGLPTGEFVAALEPDGRRFLDGLTAPGTRLVVEFRAEGETATRCALSHDRVAHVVRALCADPSLLGQAERDHIELHRFVVNSATAWAASRHPDDAALSRRRYRAIRAHEAALVRDEPTRGWWSAARAEYRRRARAQWLSGAFVLLALVAVAAGMYWANRGARIEELEADIRTRTKLVMVYRAVDTLARDYGRTPEVLGRLLAAPIASDAEAAPSDDDTEELRLPWVVTVLYEAIKPPDEPEAGAVTAWAAAVHAALVERSDELLRPELLAPIVWSLDAFVLTSEDASVVDAGAAVRQRYVDALRAAHPGWEAARRAEPAPGITPFVEVPAGTFEMGTPGASETASEHPAHPVSLSAFQMATTEVTRAQFERFPSGSPSRVEPEGRLPRAEVDWYEAYTYAAWLGGRLPTEAEWEYACRAGTKTLYWKGDSEADLAQVGWYQGNSGEAAHPVATRGGPNAFGLHDMHGNLWEWTADFYDWDSYAKSPESDPPGPSGGVRRMLRGGSWGSGADRARAACRVNGLPSNRYYDVGFRVVLPAPGIEDRP
jgi:sulfatase modifying factor 1